MEVIERIQALFDAPAQDAARGVVDDCVQVHTSAIDKAKNAGVDVPVLVGADGANSHLWFRWVHTESWSSSPSLPNETPPGHRVGEDMFGALGVEREGTDGHMAMLGRSDEVGYLAYFVETEATRTTTSAVRSVVELAELLTVDPCVVATTAESDDVQSRLQAHDGAGLTDCSKRQLP